MTFFDEHYEYIYATANAKAVEIARATGLMSDVDDIRQDLIIAILKNMETYNPTKSKPKTFISMCLNSARKNKLKSLFADKRRVDMPCNRSDCEQIREQASTAGEQLPDAINTLPAWHAKVCRSILSGRSIAQVAKENGVTCRSIMRAILDDVPALTANRTILTEGGGGYQKVLPKGKTPGNG